ncbi:MAG: hypothetical protein QM704_04710 [Anaeromyxobacteraceae bacterium]
MARRALLPLLCGLLLAALYARGCAGPRPELVFVALSPAPDGGAVPTARVRNRGGTGEVEVRFRLREVVGARVVAAEANGEVEAGETVELRAAERAPPGRWTVSAEVEYPPE